MSSAPSSEPVRCRICQQPFDNLTSLRIHFIAVHEKPKQRHICPLCYKDVVSVTVLRRHINNVHATDPQREAAIAILDTATRIIVPQNQMRFYPRTRSQSGMGGDEQGACCSSGSSTATSSSTDATAMAVQQDSTGSNSASADQQMAGSSSSGSSSLSPVLTLYVTTANTSSCGEEAMEQEFEDLDQDTPAVSPGNVSTVSMEDEGNVQELKSASTDNVGVGKSDLVLDPVSIDTNSVSACTNSAGVDIEAHLESANGEVTDKGHNSGQHDDIQANDTLSVGSVNLSVVNQPIPLQSVTVPVQVAVSSDANAVAGVCDIEVVNNTLGRSVEVPPCDRRASEAAQASPQLHKGEKDNIDNSNQNQLLPTGYAVTPEVLFSLRSLISAFDPELALDFGRLQNPRV